MTYDPIYQAGIHSKTEPEIQSELIDCFNDNSTRATIWSRFNTFLDEVRKIGIDFEVWLDGSYVTDKEEPADIDAVFFFRQADLNNLDNTQTKYVEFLFGKPTKHIIKARYQSDVFLAPLEDQNLRSYWRGWFGFTRTEVPKGIVRLIN